jgi:UDP-N-acetylglucosamine enolpyruvyl transferase
MLKSLVRGFRRSQRRNSDRYFGISEDLIADIDTGKPRHARIVLYVGALLSKFKDVRLPLPGGCDIGARPIDQHKKGFEAIGATWKSRMV